MNAGDSGIGTREQFVRAMYELSGSFRETERSIDDAKVRVFRELDDVLASVASATTVDGPKLAESPLSEVVREAEETMAAAVAEWRHRIDRFELNTAFREDFGDSLLLLVYGLVKAGKSSLGNFVAYGRHDPDESEIAALRETGRAPSYFVRALAGDENLDEANAVLGRCGKFDVDVEEATSAIQGFKLGGMTWIDSPGLGSVTERNGKLARQYTESADLVLILMNMSQPGRSPELAAIADLLGRGKPIMVLLTRADMTDRDEVDGRVVKKRIMRPDKDRREAADWVDTQLTGVLQRTGGDVLHREVQSVSVRYAEEYPSAEGLEHSGLGSLFSRLTQVAQDDGVSMKRKTPARNLSAFIDAILCHTTPDGERGLSVGRVRDQLAELLEEVDSAMGKLEARSRLAAEKAQQELIPMVENAVRIVVEDLERNVLDRRDAAARLEDRCENEARRIISRWVEEIVRETLEDVQTALMKSIELDLPRDGLVFEKVKHTVRYKAVARGRAVGSLLGGVVGGIGGFFLGGPLGAGLGASAGAAIGGASGGALAGEREVEVEVGYNENEVAERISAALGQAVEGEIGRCVYDLRTGCLLPIRRQARIVTNRLLQFEESLRNTQHSLEEAR